MTIHTDKCLAAQEEIELKRAAYFQAHPNACRSCDGWGGRESSYDPSPAGVGLGGGCFYDFEPCSDCYEQGKCPRCGGEMHPDQDLLDDDTPCLHCGFKEGDEGAAINDIDCECWYVTNAAAVDEVLDRRGSVYEDGVLQYWG